MTKKLPFLLLYVFFTTSLFGQCPNSVDYAAIQDPTTSQTINFNASYLVTMQVYENGLSNTGVGDPNRVDATIGYSDTDTDPSTWTNWVSTSYVGQTGTGGNDFQFQGDLGLALPDVGTYYIAIRISIDGCDFTYHSVGGTWSSNSVEITVVPSIVDFCNVQTPKTGSISVGGIFDVYAQVYEDGVTNGAGQGAGIECWIGYNQISENYLPDNANNWTWISANYNSSGPTGSNDEYFIDIGSSLPAGTYYYASRWRLNGGEFSYGGIQAINNGNFWDFTNNSGRLLVGSPSTLAAGDIAITGFNSDHPDQFSFVLLTDINAGTQINFTDNGWQSSGMFRNNEGTIT